MRTFIEKNKKFLKFYYVALRLSGWILLTLGLCSFGITSLIARFVGVKAVVIVAVNTPMNSLEFILFGLLGLGIAQLIRYLFDCDYRLGFILRHGSKFLYSYIILILTIMVIRNIYSIIILKDYVKNFQSLFLVTSITSIILFAAKALILIGIAQFLKRIMPIIEEHKSLI